MSRQREELYRNLTCLGWSALCPLSSCQDEFLSIQNPVWAASQKSVHHSSVLCLPIPLLPSLSSCFPLFLFLVQDSGIPFLPYFLPPQFLHPSLSLSLQCRDGTQCLSMLGKQSSTELHPQLWASFERTNLVSFSWRRDTSLFMSSHYLIPPKRIKGENVFCCFSRGELSNPQCDLVWSSDGCFRRYP